MGNGSRAAEVEALIREIQRYLVFIQAVRAGTQPPVDKGGQKDT
jgi:hypothetical protein